MVDIKRTRELLGKKGEKMTDEEVMSVVKHLRTLANIVIDEVVENKKPRE